MDGLDRDLRAAIERLGDVSRLLVALDFDGTMAPFVDRPEDARPLPASARLLAELTELPGTATALLSGRHLDGLRAAASPGPGVLLVGSHGAERWAPERYAADTDDLALDARQAGLLTEVRSRLARVAGAARGALLEDKPAGVVLHVRQSDPDTGAAALAAGRAALEDLDGVRLSDGKAVLESSVVRADKGAGLEWLRGVVGADAVLFVGDDVTDEHAFAVLRPGDVGVKVGTGATAARFRIDGTGDLPALLRAVLDVR
ncbi:trehalose-phosphatase [Arthrobacter halodurans]|uniref:Trehalose 6-phosphate phosphatase n=1 Tax=Arthrobacter halodurans TaxID=516699 RepID=A0ABV4URV9_9MICC